MNRFKIGDEIEVVDSSGANSAEKGDKGTIVRIEFSSSQDCSVKSVKIVEMKRSSDGKVIGMYAYRFKKTNKEEIIYG